MEIIWLLKDNADGSASVGRMQPRVATGGGHLPTSPVWGIQTPGFIAKAWRFRAVSPNLVGEFC
jgi:hypothetical protein